MFKLSINYVCRIYNPLHENGNESKFRFDICFRSNLILTDGKIYNNITECTNALSKFITNLAEYDNNKLTNPIIIDNFKYYGETI